MNKEYRLPYFNNTTDLRKAYEALYPDYSDALITSCMLGAMSVYIPEDEFNKLVANTLAEAEAKHNA